MHCIVRVLYLGCPYDAMTLLYGGIIMMKLDQVQQAEPAQIQQASQAYPIVFSPSGRDTRDGAIVIKSSDQDGKEFYDFFAREWNQPKYILAVLYKQWPKLGEQLCRARGWFVEAKEVKENLPSPFVFIKNNLKDLPNHENDYLSTLQKEDPLKILRAHLIVLFKYQIKNNQSIIQVRFVDGPYPETQDNPSDSGLTLKFTPAEAIQAYQEFQSEIHYNFHFDMYKDEHSRYKSIRGIRIADLRERFKSMDKEKDANDQLIVGIENSQQIANILKNYIQLYVNPYLLEIWLEIEEGRGMSMSMKYKILKDLNDDCLLADLKKNKVVEISVRKHIDDIDMIFNKRSQIASVTPAAILPSKIGADFLSALVSPLAEKLSQKIKKDKLVEAVDSLRDHYFKFNAYNPHEIYPVVEALYQLYYRYYQQLPKRVEDACEAFIKAYDDYCYETVHQNKIKFKDENINERFIFSSEAIAFIKANHQTILSWDTLLLSYEPYFNLDKALYQISIKDPIVINDIRFEAVPGKWGAVGVGVSINYSFYLPDHESIRRELRLDYEGAKGHKSDLIGVKQYFDGLNDMMRMESIDAAHAIDEHAPQDFFFVDSQKKVRFVQQLREIASALTDGANFCIHNEALHEASALLSKKADEIVDADDLSMILPLRTCLLIAKIFLKLDDDFPENLRILAAQKYMNQDLVVSLSTIYNRRYENAHHLELIEPIEHKREIAVTQTLDDYDQVEELRKIEEERERVAAEQRKLDNEAIYERLLQLKSSQLNSVSTLINQVKHFIAGNLAEKFNNDIELLNTAYAHGRIDSRITQELDHIRKKLETSIEYWLKMKGHQLTTFINEKFQPIEALYQSLKENDHPRTMSASTDDCISIFEKVPGSLKLHYKTIKPNYAKFLTLIYAALDQACDQYAKACQKTSLEVLANKEWFYESVDELKIKLDDLETSINQEIQSECEPYLHGMGILLENHCLSDNTIMRIFGRTHHASIMANNELLRQVKRCKAAAIFTKGTLPNMNVLVHDETVVIPGHLRTMKEKWAISGMFARLTTAGRHVLGLIKEDEFSLSMYRLIKADDNRSGIEGYTILKDKNKLLEKLSSWTVERANCHWWNFLKKRRLTAQLEWLSKKLQVLDEQSLLHDTLSRTINPPFPKTTQVFITVFEETVRLFEVKKPNSEFLNMSPVINLKKAIEDDPKLHQQLATHLQTLAQALTQVAWTEPQDEPPTIIEPLDYLLAPIVDQHDPFQPPAVQPSVVHMEKRPSMTMPVKKASLVKDPRKGAKRELEMEDLNPGFVLAEVTRNNYSK